MCVDLEFSNYLVDREGFQWLRWCLQEASFNYIPTIEVSIKTAQMGNPCLDVKLREDDRGAAGDQRAAGERENIDLKREDWSSFTRATGQMVIGKQELQERWWRKNYMAVGRVGQKNATLCIRHIWWGEAGNSVKRPDSS